MPSLGGRLDDLADRAFKTFFAKGPAFLVVFREFDEATTSESAPLVGEA